MRSTFVVGYLLFILRFGATTVILDSDDDCFPYEYPTSTSIFDDTYVGPGGANVETGTYIRQKKEEYSCGLFNLFTCASYSDVSCPNYRCHPGYSTPYDGATSCTEAICDGKVNSQGACNDLAEDGDYIITRTAVYFYGNGTCSAPDTCTDCAEGFYATGPKCKICPQIDKCYHRRCTNDTDNYCEWCHHEILPQKYFRGYTSHVDGGLSCQKTCSWRSDSIYCYPGWCDDELATQCNCLQGFSGVNCQNIDEAPDFLYNEVKLRNDDSSTSISNPTDPNDVTQPRDIIWTNDLTVSRLNAKLTAKYTPAVNTSIDPPSADGSAHYVTDYKAGIVQGQMSFSIRDGTTVRETESVLCSNISESIPHSSAWDCEETFEFGVQLRHGNVITWEATISNGGYVEIMDRENNNELSRHYFTGKETSVEYSYQVDAEAPYHNATEPLMSPDVTNSSTMALSWEDWVDDLSGISHFEYLINSITNGTSSPYIATKTVPANVTEAVENVINPGLYEVVLTCYDIADNYRSARRIILVDDLSVIATIDSSPITVLGASSNATNWFVQPVTMVTVSWTNHFENTRHIGSGWLEAVADYPGIERTSKYDDIFWTRTVDAMTHVRGIMEFAVKYEIRNSSGVVKQYQDYQVTPDLNIQTETLMGLTWTDGDTLEITVQAMDVMGERVEDGITVYRDSTPPIIEDIWLIKDNTSQIYVHSVEEFNEMTIEWTAYDEHSLLDTLEWRLYDHANDTIEFGREDIAIPYTNGSDCTLLSTTYSWSCYCSAQWGCQHKSFQIKPEVKLSGGLYMGMDKGVHDSDYYIEVIATNKANLVSTARTKITIDITGPHPGSVNDGMTGQNEVDYQQTLDLNGYWTGFFDRESSVIFYQYGFANRCLEASEFSSNISETTDIEQTTTTTATSTTADGPGTYYLTVVAFNKALIPSVPACSDGVTIDNSTSSIKEIKISNVRVRGGLITDTSQTDYWILDQTWQRRKIDGPTSDCSSKATTINYIDLIPIQRDMNGDTVFVNGTVFCANTSSAPATIRPILTMTSMIDIEWMGVDGSSGVNDYEVGIATTADSPAPDIMSFKSTKQHPNIRFLHADLPTGSLFYFTFNTITKTGVQTIQSIQCITDTTAPVFSGAVNLDMSGDFLIASWTIGDFTDPEDPNDFEYEFAFGTSQYRADMMSWQPLSTGGTCVLTTPPSCTAIELSALQWSLQGGHSYYTTIKAANYAGLVTTAVSGPYTYDFGLPSEGVVIDIDSTSVSTTVPYKDIEDVDFQTDQASLAARWWGFSHQYLSVSYDVTIGTTSGADDILSKTNVGTDLQYQATGLTLIARTTYYITVTAVTSLNNVTVTSDGVTVLDDTEIVPMTINDGDNCNMIVDTTNSLFTHHDQDNRFACAADIDFQPSTTTIQAHWTVPAGWTNIIHDVFFSVEEETSSGGGTWTTIHDLEYIYNEDKHSVNNLNLSPGKKYRVNIKPCAGTTCFPTIQSDGVTVLSSNPVTVDMNVTHLDASATGASEKLEVTFGRFFDPDVSGPTRYTVIDHYEYAITDNSLLGNTHVTWTTVSPTFSFNVGTFDVSLSGTMDFSKCRRFVIRGYNKAMIWSSISSDIKDCQAFDPILISPRFNVDAMGQAESTDDTKGSGVYLEENAIWYPDDVDYTPYKNVLSAVWHSGRYSWYTWAVVNAHTLDVTTYYQQLVQLNLTDPCSHPDVVHNKCGNTTNEYINVYFNENEYLVHGERYSICIHANAEVLRLELWDNVLPEISICTDGVMVDLTSPVAGSVWIGNVQGIEYQSHTSDMYVNWESFKDVEAFGTTRHSTGISYYTVAIGTSVGGNDVIDFTNVGVVNHAHFGSLTLMSGRKYYASVVGYDFAGRSTTKTTDAVMVDNSAPLKSNKPITLSHGRHLTSKSEILACWTGVFSDPESGVAYYEWAIGSKPGYNDKMASTVVYTACASSSVSSPLNLQEGHAYYINVRAFNRAGLSSLASSWAYVLDLSPPIPGYVYDGERGINSSVYVDEDYQAHANFLAAFWTGFHDPHSTITEYYVSIGTCMNCQNILTRQPIGITEDFKLSKFNLAFGVTYYTTVTACNTAELCSSTTSDGIMIDVSAPTPGRVFDGTDTDDIEYQGSGIFIGARWYGFSDPQSGIERYVWKAGTTEGGDDVLGQTDLHLDKYVINTSVALPAGVRLYITVGCYDMAGMYSQATSNGFLVDDTHPVIEEGPLFSTDFGVYLNPSMQYYHRDKATLKVYWRVTDDVSHIERQYVSISSHIGGEFSRSPVKINGIVRYYIFSNLDLHDGVAYYVNLICCNGAGLCSNATSPSIIMDSSFPTRGMFAVQTEHASDLTRHLTTWMTWTLESLSLAWLGFSDLQTGIDYYGINVGSTFMGNDLNEIADQAYTVYHNNTGVDRGDEGILQTNRITTQSLLTVSDIYIHLWAVNKAGLRSPVIHNQFTKAADGSLVLVRRCSAHTCDGHCVCAPQDQRCPITTTCNNDTDTRSNSYIQVTDILGTGLIDATYTPSVSVLRASWEIIMIQNLSPLWYEWSVGIESGTSPIGLIDVSIERVWHDAGKETQITYVTSKDNPMVEGMKYSVFVRVWYSTDTFGDFKSDGVIIQTQEPRTTVLAGAAITEVERYSGRKDMDYITDQAPITIGWTNKFLNVNTDISEFKVYVSSFPGGHDSSITEASLGHQESSYTLINHNLPTGRRFYSNVMALNHVGMYVTESSDGFTFDGDVPMAGTVIDGLGLQDIDYQDDSSSVGARWYGFTDLGSSIHFYTWCVGSTVAMSGNTMCDIINATNVGLHTEYQANLPSGASTCMYNKVYATDVTGYASPVAVSNGICIDTSVPVPEYLTVLYQNVLENSNFTEAMNAVPYNNLNSTDICQMSTNYKPTMWTENTGSCAVVVESGFAKSGSNFAYIIGSLSQVVSLDEGLYKLSFVTSHGLINVAEHANKEGFVQLGGQNHVFLIYTKAYRSDDTAAASDRDSVVWHNHTFYFKTDSAASYNVTIGSVDLATGFFIDDIQLHFVNKSISGTNNYHVIGHMVFLHEWSSIHGSWSFISDGYVDIIDYSWAIGYVPYGTQLQDYTSTGLKHYGYNNNVTLVQNSSLYITVMATNSLGNRAIAVSERVFIDMTPPTISEVNDGTGLDEDYSEITTVFVNFQAEDLDSGIDFCEWAIGYSSNGIEIQPFTTISSFYGDVSIGIDQAEGRTIYSTVRCTNKAGLVASNSSDGIKISQMSPNASQAQINHMPLSSTQYQPLEGFQGVNNTIKLYWSGFTDTLGISQHVIYVDLSNVTTHITKGMTFSENQIVKFSQFSNLTLYQGIQEIDLYARNILGIPSDTISYNFTVQLEQPGIQANSTPNITWSQAATEFTVDWTDIFTSPFQLRYEVSAGLAEGGAEILQWQETTNTTLVFGMPSHVDDYSGSVVYMHIRAISAGGIYNDIKGTVTLP